MTRKDAAQIISIFQANYPDSFRDKTDEMLIATINLWATMFADDDARTVTAAVMAHIASDSGRFMPPVGVIKNMLHRVENPNAMTEAEAWAKIRKAVANSNYEAKEEFEKLPPVLQRLVGSPNHLRDWAGMDSDTFNSVVASNVQRVFRTVQEREREVAALPSSVRAVIGEVANRLELEESYG